MDMVSEEGDGGWTSSIRGNAVKSWPDLFETQTSPGSGENSSHTICKGHKHGLFLMTCFSLLARLGVQPRGGFPLYPWNPKCARIMGISRQF